MSKKRKTTSHSEAMDSLSESIKPLTDLGFGQYFRFPGYKEIYEALEFTSRSRYIRRMEDGKVFQVMTVPMDMYVVVAEYATVGERLF